VEEASFTVEWKSKRVTGGGSSDDDDDELACVNESEEDCVYIGWRTNYEVDYRNEVVD